MIIPDNTVFRFMDWIAKRLGFDFDLQKDCIVDSLDEHEVSEQLQYGRD